MTKAEIKRQIQLCDESIKLSRSALREGVDNFGIEDAYKLTIQNNEARKKYWQKKLDERT